MNPNKSETCCVGENPQKPAQKSRKTLVFFVFCVIALAISLFLDGRVDAALQVQTDGMARSLARDLTKIGEWWSVGAAGIVIAVYFSLRGRPGVARGIVLATVAGLATGFVATPLRFLIGRARPNAGVAAGFYGPWHDGHFIFGQYQFSSFPSGHAATLFGLAAAAWILNRRAGVGVAVFAALVSWSRLAQSNHHFSDVVASGLLGLWLGPIFVALFRPATEFILGGAPASEAERPCDPGGAPTPGWQASAAGVVSCPPRSLRYELERSGAWLFRYRSYLPLLTIPFFLFSLRSFAYIDESHRANEMWQSFCLGVSILGLVVRIITVGRAPRGTSGRNTREQVAETLNTTGIYSIVRHPLYLGNFLITLGFALWPHQAWMAVLMTLIYMIYYERIMLAEEAFLRERFGARFEDWAGRTPAFIPKLSGWKPSAVPFCWRTVGQREYNAFFLIIAVFFIFDLVGDSIVEGDLRLRYGWFSAFLAAFAVSTTLRTVKKRTRFLHVADR